MDIFEFIMTLQSIIVGLAMAEVLSGLARMVARRRHKKPSLMHAALAIGTILALMQLWWEGWGLRSHPAWTVPMLLHFMAVPVLVFIIAHLLFPGPNEDVGYEDHYFENSRIIWILIASTMGLASAFSVVFLGAKVFVTNNLSSLVTVAVGFGLAWNGNRSLHRVAVPCVMLAILVDIFIGNYAIS